MNLTVAVPDNLARRLKPLRDKLPTIIELGLRELDETDPGFSGLADVIELLARLPGPEEVLALHASKALQKRVSALIEKAKAARLTAAEEREWARYEYIEHIVRMAKARAVARQKAS
jgi:hypothetical protein